jgi:hypothetical protein
VDACVGQQVQVDFTFLSPEPTQITTATSSAPTLSNWTEITNTSGITAQIIAQFTPTPAEVGFHIVTFEGTDNGVPPLTATYNIVVNVFPAPATASGSQTVCSSDPMVDLFSLLAPPLPAGGTWVDPNGNANSGMFNPATDPPGDYLYAVGTGGGLSLDRYGDHDRGHCSRCGLRWHAGHLQQQSADGSLHPAGGDPGCGWIMGRPGWCGFLNPLDPSVAAAGNYVYTAFGTFPCPNDQSNVAVSIATAVDAGGDASVSLCEDAPPMNMLAQLAGTPDATGNWFTPGGALFGGTFNASVDPQACISM